MALKGALGFAVVALLLGACGSEGPKTPHVTLNVVLNGDLGPLRPAGDTSERSLQVALVWGAQWFPEPLCLLPPESAAAAGVIAAGCRDPFGFVPAIVAASVPIAVGGSATLTISQSPPANLLIGDVTARVAFGSLVVYDDRDDSKTLELAQPHPTPDGASRVGVMVTDPIDVIYGTSFLTMTEPDQRVAYREGGFDATGTFYPRAGCAPPPVGFSIVGAGGFTAAAALKANVAGTLPEEDPATCFEGSASATVVNVVARAPADVDGVGCAERTDLSRSRYLEPPANMPDFTGRLTACTHVPSVDASGPSADGGANADAGAPATSLIQLVVSDRATDKCKGLTHYTLRGCRYSVSCSFPDWDLTATPPPWWPCPH